MSSKAWREKKKEVIADARKKELQEQQSIARRFLTFLFIAVNIDNGFTYETVVGPSGDIISSLPDGSVSTTMKDRFGNECTVTVKTRSKDNG
jgi:hypothetical protein